MSDDLIERIWKQAPGEPPLSRDELARALTPRADRGSRILRRYVRAYLAVQLGTLSLVGLNLVGYRSNSIMLAAELAVGLAALAFVFHALKLRPVVNGLEQMDEPLDAALRRRLAFYGSHARAWTWLAPLSIVGFNFALNSWIDNRDGAYTIHHPFVFVGVQVAMMAVLVVSFRVAHEPYLREARAMLADLEAQLLDRTVAVDQGAGRWRRLRVALIVLLSASLALGAWMAWRAG